MSLIHTLQTLLEKQDFSSDYASFVLPFDTGSEDERKKLVEKYKSVENIALVWIWGSNLGTIAIHESLRDNDILGEKNISFFDTPDPEYTKQAIESIEIMLEAGENLLIIVISKSGTTTETLALADILYRKLFLPYRSQVDIVTISDPLSKLDNLAKSEWWDRLNLPPKVGGRYSVFSNVGLFPLALLGYDTDELLVGARDALSDFLHPGEKSRVQSEAMTLFAWYNSGRNIYEHWFFAKKLESLGKWYRQLLAESIGKIKQKKEEISQKQEIQGSENFSKWVCLSTNDWEKFDTDTEVRSFSEISVGITPSTALGTIDLHSIAQLDLAHTKDRMIHIVSLVSDDDFEVGNSPFTSILWDIVWKKATEILSAAISGFEQALREKWVPVSKSALKNKSCYDIGYWMQSKMLEVALLGELFEIDPFDQPNVEDYKKHMKTALK
jgi:glucose-6-phosphate isomerase